MIEETEKPFEPLESGNGRDPVTGRFTEGNRFGVGFGNPYSQAVAQFRAALLAAVTAEDIQEIVKVLVAAAKAGDTVSAKVILDRCCGRIAEWSETEEPRKIMLSFVRAEPPVKTEQKEG
jgi:hypothetical protein